MYFNIITKKSRVIFFYTSVMAYFSPIIHLLNQNNITAIVLWVEIISSFSVVFFSQETFKDI